MVEAITLDDRNLTLLVDAETRDIIFDDDGHMQLIFADETTAQCVRLTLQTWKEEFFLDTSHGTEYERILGKKNNDISNDEAAEVIREAIFQELDVAEVDRVSVSFDDVNRQATSFFIAKLRSGATISTEVTA